jgi:vitamin B12 transporter
MADQSEVIQAPDVVVSATKTPVPAKQVTSAVEVITGEEICNSEKSEPLQKPCAGHKDFRSTRAEAWARALMSGCAGEHRNRRSCFIDGAIVNSATIGNYDFANLTSDNIERIEILRGSQSMLWGSDAMGGVINITTKRGRDKPNVSAFAEYGSFNTIREGASLAGKKGPIDFSGSIARLDTAGFSAINYRRGATERDGYHNWQGSVRLGADLPKDGRLEFSFRWLAGRCEFRWICIQSTHLHVRSGRCIWRTNARSSQYVFAGNYSQSITTWWSHTAHLIESDRIASQRWRNTEQNVVTGATEPVGFPFKSQIETTSNQDGMAAQHSSC